MIDEGKLKSIENLHRLKTEGVITDEEFEKAKRDLLEGHQPSVRSLAARDTNAPAEDDWFGWMTLPLRRYAQFDGRSSRKEFWMFQLILVAIFVVAGLVAAIDTDEYGEGGALGTLTVVMAILAYLGLLVPQIAVQVRRFHDQDKSGWLALMNLIPYVGALVALGFMLVPGTEGENQYGPDPRQS